MHARGDRTLRLKLGGARLAALVGGLLIAAAAVGALVQRHVSPAVLPAAYADALSGDVMASLRDGAFARENLKMLAGRLGTLQGKLAAMDGLSRRVAETAGVPYGDSASQAAEGEVQIMDGLLIEPVEHAQISAEELGRQIDGMLSRLGAQQDRLNMLDLALTRREADLSRLPSAMPVSDYPYLSSSYGWRRHPVTGRYAMHEGLDFAAPRGTPILAASAGIVVDASYQTGYGNTVEIDHGDGLLTRYAHASELLVKRGDVVERGQEVAKVGSTGRSTGSHLHFEVRMAGQPLDPRMFLNGNGQPVALSATALAAAAGEPSDEAARVR